jgi:hypothetical protein
MVKLNKIGEYRSIFRVDSPEEGEEEEHQQQSKW